MRTPDPNYRFPDMTVKVPVYRCPSCPVIIPGQGVADRIQQHRRTHE